MMRTLGLGLGLAGCTSSLGSGSTSSPGTLGPGPECTQGVPVEVVDAQIAVMEETGESYHEMVACGGLAYDMAASVERILVLSLLESGGVSVPGGYVYEGEGRYVTASGSSAMTVVYLHEDELVVHDLFDFDNFLVGVQTELDVLAQELIISYDETGPLVELLGKGESPANPFRLGLSDIESPKELGQLKIVASVETQDVRPGATVTYTLSSRPQRLNPLLSGNAALTFDLTSSSTLAGNGATLVSTSMGIDYQDSPGTLDGDVTFEVRGGGLDLDGVLSFDQSTYATLDWWCPQ